MAASIQRPRPIPEHPVSRNKYVIPTPSIDAFYTRVKSSIVYHRTGDMVYGQTGFGKTSAIRCIRRNLAIDFPRLVTIRLQCRKSKSRSEDAFFANFLATVGHDNPTAGTIARKRLRLKQMLLERVERSKRDTIVIFPDEAQRMEVMEFEWLRDVYDEIDEAGVRPLVYPVGQPQLRSQKATFQNSQNMQIVGRFMTREHAFHGLKSVHDVATCLAGYDGNCFPERSDWTYLRLFFPCAWEDGLRLLESARDVWDAFGDAHAAAGLPGDLEIPMKYFALAVGIALLKYHDQDDEGFRFTRATWDDAVAECDYESALRSTTFSMIDSDDGED